MQKEIKLVHPAYSIADNILFLGFSNREFNQNYLNEEAGDKKNENKWINKNLHLVVQIDELGKPSLKILTNPEIEINNVLYVFEPDENGKDRKLPKIDNKWSKELLDKCRYKIQSDKTSLYYKLSENLKSYIWLEKEDDYNLLLCWIIGTYFYQVFEAYPYIHLKGVKGSGKSTGLDFITLTAFNACKDSATYSSMRDKIDGQRATFLNDQADYHFGENADSEMLNVMIGSYKKSGGRITKSVEIKKRYQNVDFDIYCPKGFASVRELHHDLKDRCIQFNFYKSKSNLLFLKEESKNWIDIRNDLYKLLMSEFVNVANIYTELQAKYLDDQTIKGRALELWLPIETMLELFNFDEVKITAVRKNFLAKVKNTEDGFSINQNLIIEKIISLVGESSNKIISLKEIIKGLNLSKEEEDIGKNSSIYVGGVIKKLNLYTSKKRRNDGWSYLFEKVKLENISASDPENSSLILTTENVPKLED